MSEKSKNVDRPVSMYVGEVLQAHALGIIGKDEARVLLGIENLLKSKASLTATVNLLSK